MNSILGLGQGNIMLLVEQTIWTHLTSSMNDRGRGISKFSMDEARPLTLHESTQATKRRPLAFSKASDIRIGTSVRRKHARGSTPVSNFLRAQSA